MQQIRDNMEMAAMYAMAKRLKGRCTEPDCNRDVEAFTLFCADHQQVLPITEAEARRNDEEARYKSLLRESNGQRLGAKRPARVV